MSTRGVFLLLSQVFYMIAVITQKDPAIWKPAWNCTDCVAAIAKEFGRILGCRVGVHGFNSRGQQNNSQGLKNN